MVFRPFFWCTIMFIKNVSNPKKFPFHVKQLVVGNRRFFSELYLHQLGVFTLVDSDWALVDSD